MFKKMCRNFGVLDRAGKCLLLAGVLFVQGCAQADVPDPRNANVPNPMAADERREAVNERPDSVMFLPLGEDVLIPEVVHSDPLPNDIVGPFELRSETLAGALQLILSDYDVSLAFESDEGFSRTVTVANLRGPLNQVVQSVCSLADLYCSYERGIMIVKETQVFTVKIPPISSDTSFLSNIANGLGEIIGNSPITDTSTRTIIYKASHRTSEMAERYFQRMRTSTALIVYETYIWEVSLNSGNSTGIKWDHIKDIGKYTTGFTINGSVGADFSNPVSIGLPTTKDVQDANGELTATEIFQFLSQFGAVKTISQPQITVLSGSSARLRAADTENYVSQVAETIDNGQSTTSVSTSSVDTGFTIEIESAWDNATVYANIDIALTDVAEIEDFDFTSGGGGTTTVQLPKTTERELTTQVRVRPGDSVLIAGLVRESDNFSEQGPGTKRPWFASSRTATTENLELVFLLRPRVVVYTSPAESQYYNSVRGTAVSSSVGFDPKPGYGQPYDDRAEYDYTPLHKEPPLTQRNISSRGSSPILLNGASAPYEGY